MIQTALSANKRGEREQEPDTNLIDITGREPTKFARTVVKKIFGKNYKNYVLTDDGRKPDNSPREPISLEIRDLIRSRIKN